MILDNKNARAQDLVSTQDKKLSIELPNAKQIYTTGSSLTGILRLGAKDLEGTLSVKVAIMCVVRSVHHRYYGGTTHDIRRETTKLMHREQVLWSSSGEDASPPPLNIPFNITIPDVGEDKRANYSHAALPPSFQAGSRRGWRNFGTHHTPIGFVKYQVHATVARKGAFTRNDKVSQPFLFLPPSPAPELLPVLPEVKHIDPMHLPESLWEEFTTSTSTHNMFSANGEAQLRLWLPRATHLPRMTRIPFVLCFVIATQMRTGAVVGLPSKEILPPAAQIPKATLFLQQKICTCARGGTQTHLHTIDATPADNFLFGLGEEESEWTPKTLIESGMEKGCWEKRYIWHGTWMCRKAPSFVNRQITCQYRLVGEVPIKGLGNGVKVVSDPLEISSGVPAGSIPPPSSEENFLDLPPDYFSLDGAMDYGDENDKEDEKS